MSTINKFDDDDVKNLLPIWITISIFYNNTIIYDDEHRIILVDPRYDYPDE